MIALGIYTLVLFLVGVMSAVVTYYMLLYRDPRDIVGVVLVLYYFAVATVLVGTVTLLDFTSI